MNPANPKVIRALLTSTSEGEFRQTFERYKMESAVASVVREHWSRRLSGRCVQCGHELATETDLAQLRKRKVPFNRKKPCPVCKTALQSNNEMLERLNKNSIILKCTCSDCGKVFSYTVGRVMEITKRHGIFVPSKICLKCRFPEEQKKPQKAPEEKKAEAPKQEEVVPEPTEVLVRGPAKQLTHRPFAALKDLNIQVRQKGSKRPKK